MAIATKQTLVVITRPDLSVDGAQSQTEASPSICWWGERLSLSSRYVPEGSLGERMPRSQPRHSKQTQRPFLKRGMLLNLSSITIEGTTSHFVRMDTLLSAAEGVSWKYLGMAEGMSEKTREWQVRIWLCHWIHLNKTHFAWLWPWFSPGPF